MIKKLNVISALLNVSNYVKVDHIKAHLNTSDLNAVRIIKSMMIKNPDLKLIVVDGKQALTLKK